MKRRIKAIELEPGMHLAFNESDEENDPHRWVITQVRTTAHIVYETVDDNCPDGGCQGCGGGGEIDWEDYSDGDVLVDVFVPGTFKTNDLVVGNRDAVHTVKGKVVNGSPASWTDEVHAVSRVHPDEPWIELHGREGIWYLASLWKLYEPPVQVDP